MIEVKNLVKVYGDHTAVNNLSFTVESGQIYGFLGPNGAGKSTTMNIMTGYIAATSGEVLINGHDILEEPEEAKKYIGYLPEMPPLYNDMTVIEYLHFAAELKHIDKETRTQAVEDAIEATKLNEMRSRLIKNLSKGYRQRVGLAQAILGYPEVIILDEPTVGLDPKQIIEIRDLIKQLAQNHTIILSSHILSEVSAVCDHILIISHGNLVASDTPENLSKLMKSSTYLDLDVKAAPDQVTKVLSGLPGILEQEVHDAAGDITHARLTTDPADDIRERLFFAFADARLPILTMKTETMSLEDVFLELTQAAPAEQTEAPRRRLGNRRKKTAPAAQTEPAAAGSSGEDSPETETVKEPEAGKEEA